MRTVDVMVVGGGLAGLTSALRAAELGCEVVILEKGASDAYPCNSRFAGGIIHIAYHDPKDPADAIMSSIRAATSDEVDMELAQSIAENGARTIDWLVSQGGKFMRFSQTPWHRWCMAPPRPIGYGLDWKGRGPDLMLRTLTARFLATRGEIRYGARASGLSKSGAGYAITLDSGDAMEARAVVIADGGFQADPDLFRRFIGPHPEKVRQRNSGASAGDGLKMAHALGAALVRTDRFYGHLLHRESLTNENLWPYPQLDELVASTILVDASGRRFVDEGIGGIRLANEFAASEDPARATVVLDAAIWDGPGKYGRIPLNPHMERAGGTILKSDTLEGLARLAGIDPANLGETVKAWNAACDSGNFAALSPSRTTVAGPGKLETMTPWAIRKAPFMAMPVCPGITHTMGGILIDRNAQVLREDRTPIAGLFAAGAATGGLEGGGTVGYTGGLSKACVFGLLAGEGAARMAKAR